MLLTFYNFLSPHWAHINISDPMEPTFPTVRVCSNRSPNSGSRDATLAMLFKLPKHAAEHWRCIKISNQLVRTVNNARLHDGEPGTGKLGKIVARPAYRRSDISPRRSFYAEVAKKEVPFAGRSNAEFRHPSFTTTPPPLTTNWPVRRHLAYSA